MRKCVIAVFDTDDVDQTEVSALDKNVPKGTFISDYIVDNLGWGAWESCRVYDVEDFVKEFNSSCFGDEDMLKAFYVEEDDDSY